MFFLHRLLGMVSMADPTTTTIKILRLLRFHDNTNGAPPMGCDDRSETGSFHQSTCLKIPEVPSLKFSSGSVTVMAYDYGYEYNRFLRHLDDHTEHFDRCCAFINKPHFSPRIERLFQQTDFSEQTVPNYLSFTPSET